MKSRTWMWTAVVHLLATLAVAIGMAAQDNPSQNDKAKHQGEVHTRGFRHIWWSDMSKRWAPTYDQ